MRGAAVEFVDWRLVAERDEWECHLCGDGIDSWRSFPDRLSASIDHVIPIARGGPHAYDNVRLAHLGCNAAKGAKCA